MKRLIIIGGGFAGSSIAKELEEKFSVVLIDTKNYFEYTPSILRTIVEPEHMQKVQIKHKDYLKNTKIITNKVKEITKEVVITSGTIFKYDYLVICSGSRYNKPIKQENVILTSRASVLRNYAEKLKKSNNVLIIGGGLVGVELAAEICTKFPKKEITLCHSRDKLLNRNNKKTQTHCHNFLERHGVKLNLSQRVIINHDYFTTTKGEKIPTDLTFICTGISPNSEFMEKTFSNYLNEKGFIEVNKFMQLKGHENIFVAGDATAINEEKTAQNAERHAKIVIKNIKNITLGKKLKPYISSPRIMDISLGKNDGVITYKNYSLTGLSAGLLKNLIEWKEMLKRTA
jgi:apoptosis-inducing factor 2